VDAQGNVVVTAPAGDAFATYRYNVTGQQQWLATYPAAGFDSAPIEVAMDPEGNAYVVGYADDHTHTIKYAPDGTQVWAQKLEAPVGPMEPVGIGVDAAHNVFIAGTSGGGLFSDTPAAIAAVRYSQGAP
jgi:outer membrane protein assembly factor BamB